MRFSLLLLPVVLFACGGSDSSPRTPTSPTSPTTPTTPTAPTPVVTNAVTMSGDKFVPPLIQVTPGQQVTFTNSDNRNHNVVFATGNVAPTGNYSTGARTLTMPTPVGTYEYQCTLHGGMTGSVVVK